MTNEAVITHISQLLAGSFEAEPAAIDPKATLADLELDSLAVVEFYVALGEHYGVTLDDSNDQAAQTPLHQIADQVTTLLKQKD